MKVGFFGLFGSYTNQAAKEIFTGSYESVEFVEFIFLEEIFKFIQNDNLAVIPIENSSGGLVSQVLDMFPRYDFSIIGEYFLPINHVLLASNKLNISQIKEVYAHPQAIAQVSKFLEKNKINGVPYSDNSSSAKYIRDNNFYDKAAIGSEVLANIYNLEIIKRNFQNSNNNTTRFLVIGKTDNNIFKKNNLRSDSYYKTSLIFTVRDISGVLYKCLGGFATNNINLTRIESRPIKNKYFDYFFFLEFEGNLKDKKVIMSLEELNFYTKEIKTFGSYQKI